MAARRESGTPSAQTVLEVADGLRWTDPALGVSLAEHARRLAGDDDPATRAAAERSILRSLAEADRYDEVVHRAGPLLDEARQRGDRDDVAAVLVELASAAVGLGDGSSAWTMVDRLRSVDDLPARVAAAAALVRTRVRAENGDVVGTDGEAEGAVPVLVRVPEPEAGLLRREMTCARARARRRAGDLTGALAVLASATTDDPADDPDGGRRSLAAAAEQIELLVEIGRADEARARARALTPHGPVEPALLRVVSRIRVVLAEVGGGDVVETRTAAQALEDAGHLDDAARAWQVVASGAETSGDLGGALAALRHGHGLESRARDEHERSLRRIAAVEVSDLPVAARAPIPQAPATEPPAPETGPRAVETGPPAVEASSSEEVVEALPRRRGHRRDEETPTEAAPTAPDPLTAAAPGSSPGRVDDQGTGLGRQDELADLLAALSRSMEQLPGPALAASDADPGAFGPLGVETGPMHPNPTGTLATVGDPSTNGGRREESSGPADEPVPTTGRRSRHSASGDRSGPEGEGPETGPPAVSRPTFDAFSTAPLRGREDPTVTPGPVSDGATSERGVREGSYAESASLEVPTWPAAASEPSVSVDRFTPVRGAAVRGTPDPDQPTRTPHDVEVVSGSTFHVWSDQAAEPIPTQDEPAGDPGRNAAAVPTPSPAGDRPERSTLSPVGEGPEESKPSESSPSESKPSRASARPRPTPREESTRGEHDGRSAKGRSEPAGGRAPRGTNGATTPDELQEDLGLTLASVLGEYDLPDVPMPPRTDRQRSSADVAVPSARRHTSGAMPVPAEGRRDLRDGAVEPQTPRAPAAGGRPRPPESGPRLADLLAEAMDAFRHAGPAVQDESRPPGVGSRRA